MSGHPPFSLFRPGARLPATVYHTLDLGRRLSALAGGRDVALEPVAAIPLHEACAAALKVVAVDPRAGAPEVLAYVARPDIADLRGRVALALALAGETRFQTKRRAA